MLAALPLLSPSLVLCLFLPIVPVSATLLNITVDDTDGDASGGSTLSFSPHAMWSEGQDCPGCNVHSGNTSGTVDVSQVFDGTWHDSTYHPGDLDHTVSVSFTGTAVYVYNIIANQIPYTTTLTNLTFWINSDLVGSYVHIPENTTALEYNVLVYSNTSLPNGQHFFTMSAGGPNASLILFDRLVYTQDSTNSLASGSSVSISFPSSTSLLATSAPVSASSKSTPPIGAIVGGVVGGVVGLAILGLVAFLVFRARRQTAARRPPPAAEKIDPFVFGGGAQHPQGRRMSRAPILPDLRFGRSRLMPRGPGSTVTSTDASSSTETRTADGFQGHRPRLPPMSPAETARSREAAEYLSRIQALEAQVRALEVQQQLGGRSDASGSRTQLSHGSSTQTRSRRSRSRGRSGRSGRSANASASAANLRSELASLRSEIAALRGELSQDQLGVLEAAPSYVS
ncbi:hypothetical protein GSI_05964 [Ganoderma sinense ZZ0214-1]|uniref:Transporter n=1 Tax=Ganoderma sinense ZZ0214-1 TaxID=1077348 RepID=A0A2G8SBX1_9APHY|nr:hypothetical protein GSI_05964 [Ganoderma sinense ZZ0214-1]